MNELSIYVLTFNLPNQFQLWLDYASDSDTGILDVEHKYLLNNSTDPHTFESYSKMCRLYGFEEIKEGNLGISGGRIFCARHFHEANHEYMLYFEDDMMLNGPCDGVCRNGTPLYIPNLLQTSIAISQQHHLDYLKLNYSEFFGDNTNNWAYRNCTQEEKDAYFPHHHKPLVYNSGRYDQCYYLLGDMHYCNWPLLMNQRGSRIMFGEDCPLQHEQQLMVRALKLTRSGMLRAGLLLATPIMHQRSFFYVDEERKEW